jgi:hypothetical protein
MYKATRLRKRGRVQVRSNWLSCSETLFEKHWEQIKEQIQGFETAPVLELFSHLAVRNQLVTKICPESGSQALPTIMTAQPLWQTFSGLNNSPCAAKQPTRAKRRRAEKLPSRHQEH